MSEFSPSSPPRIFWNSRKRLSSGRSLENTPMAASHNNPSDQANDDRSNEGKKSELSERRKALFEPLEPTRGSSNGHRRTLAEDLLPPPDFDSTTYPKGWLVGKKRKLVNVDVVESMRRIAIQEMNRKDREIDGLNEQLEEDAKCLELLQHQLLQERSKRADVERENTLLQEQISMLMGMLEESEAGQDETVSGDS